MTIIESDAYKSQNGHKTDENYDLRQATEKYAL